MLSIRSINRLAEIAALLVIMAFVANGQSPAGRNSVSGLVQDQAGAAISGAIVEIAAGSSTQQSTTTDQSGSFRFNRLPSGKYQVKVRSEGFEVATVDVTVGSQQQPSLQVVMAIASLHQETTVTSEPVTITTESTDNKDTVALSEQTLSNLPVFDQDYIGAMSRFLDPGSVGTNGVSLVVNGMEVNNPGVSPSAIKEIKINQDPYSAEYQRPGRGRIEVTTKPGSPEYHGTFNFIFRDAHLNARAPFALTRPPEQRRIYEGFLSGPIRRSKKTSFLFSVSRKEEDLQSIVVAQGLAGAIRANVPAPSRTLQLSAQITHAVSDTNTFSVRESLLIESVNNQNVGGTTLPEAGVNSRNMEEEITFSQQVVLSPKLVNNFRLLLGVEKQSNESVNDNRRIVVLDAFTGGGAQANSLRTEYHAQLMETLSYSTGKHLIKAGINVPDLSRGIVFASSLSRGLGLNALGSVMNYANGKVNDDFYLSSGDRKHGFSLRAFGVRSEVLPGRVS